MKHLKALAEIVVCLVVAAAICVGAAFGAKAIVKVDDERKDVKRCIEDIAEWLELEDFAYTVQQIRFFGEDYDEGARYYLIVVYDDYDLHRYEFACEVYGNEVDCDLVRDDVMEY